MRARLLLLKSLSKYSVTKAFFSSSIKCYSISPKELSIIFFGSDDFSVSTLQFLHKKLLDPRSSTKIIIKNLEVVTTKCSNPVSLFCKNNDLPIHYFDGYLMPPNLFDIGVVSSFGRLIPLKFISDCRHGMLNVHCSLLPRWRGASPIQHTILNGDTITGITIMMIKPYKFDVGNIVAQKSIEILYRISALELKQLLAPIGAKLLWNCVEDLDYYLNNMKEQSDEGATYAPKIKKSDGEIDWNRMDSYEIDRRFRAFNGIVDVYTDWIDGTRLKLGDIVDPDLVSRFKLSTLIGSGLEHIPGMIYYHKRRHILCIASANGTWSAFRSFTLKGRKKMSALGFSNTFIRPMIKRYKEANRGEKPFLILGKMEEQRGMFSACEIDKIVQKLHL